jgi:hypothetical protein
MPRFVAVVAGALSLLVALTSVEAEEQPNPDELLLRQAGLDTKGPALLDFFRNRIPNEATHRQIIRLVELLDSIRFQDRQQAGQKLIGIGPAALPELRRATVGQSLELTRRAEQYIREIENSATMGVSAAAARLLRARKPEGASAVLFEFLPFAEDEGTEEAVLAALADLGVRDGKPDSAIVSAADDRLPVRRMAAAAVLARSALAEQRLAARKFLEDAEPRVQIYAARALLMAQDKAAVPRLLALITDGPLDVARQADNLLCRIAGERVPLELVEGSDWLARDKSRDAWAAWWKANEGKVDLSKLGEDDRLDPELERLIERSAKIIRESLQGKPTPRLIERARAQAVMVAVYAQSGPAGANTFRRATLRDAALRLAATLRDNKTADARKQAHSLLYLHSDPRAPLGTVHLLDRHIELKEAMGQFASEKGRGLGVEARIDRLLSNAQITQRSELPQAALNDELIWTAQQVAHVAAWIKQDYNPPNKKVMQWKTHAETARQAALDLAGAARARNGPEAWLAMKRVEAACCNCHEVFR